MSESWVEALERIGDAHVHQPFDSEAWELLRKVRSLVPQAKAAAKVIEAAEAVMGPDPDVSFVRALENLEAALSDYRATSHGPGVKG